MIYAVADLVIRIKNGYLAHREDVEIPHSTFSENILKKLKGLKFIKDYQVSGDIKKSIHVDLLYNEDTPAMSDVKIFSTPGRRWYVRSKKLKPVLSGFGVSVLSTPKGIMTNIEAKKQNLGGELLFQIW